jgi:hypothetical protein
VQEEAEQEYEVIKVACCNTAGLVASTFGKHSFLVIIPISLIVLYLR